MPLAFLILPVMIAFAIFPGIFVLQVGSRVPAGLAVGRPSRGSQL